MNKSAEETMFESLLPTVSVLAGGLSPNAFMALMVMLDRVADTLTEVEQSAVVSAADMLVYMEDNPKHCNERLAIAVMQPDKGVSN